MVELDGTRDYFGKQWLEDDIVLSIDQAISVRSSSSAERIRPRCTADVNAAESAA